MLGTDHLFVGCQRTFAQRSRSRKIALDLKATREALPAIGRMQMIGAEHFFADRQRAFVELPRSRKIAFKPKQAAEIV